MAAWTDYGPAEFDRSRCPAGAKTAPKEQGSMFVIAREAKPAKRVPIPEELPGQAGMFGEDGE